MTNGQLDDFEHYCYGKGQGPNYNLVWHFHCDKVYITPHITDDTVMR